MAEASEHDEEQRSPGVVVDLEALQTQAEDLFLHRFVEYVREARGEHGRYLILRAGDAAAIRAASDGSEEYLEQATVEREEFAAPNPDEDPGFATDA